MQIEQPAPLRSTIVEQPDSLTFRIPARAPFYLSAFIALWLFFWLAMGIATIGQSIAQAFQPAVAGRAGSPIWYVVTGIVGWLGVGGIVGYFFLRMTIMVDELRLDHQTLSLRRAVGRFGRTRRFDLARLGRFRNAPGFNLMAPGLSPPPTETITFRYGAKTIRFAFGLDEAEADIIVERLNGWLARVQRAP